MAFGVVLSESLLPSPAFSASTSSSDMNSTGEYLEKVIIVVRLKVEWLKSLSHDLKVTDSILAAANESAHFQKRIEPLLERCTKNCYSNALNLQKQSIEVQNAL